MRHIRVMCEVLADAGDGGLDGGDAQDTVTVPGRAYSLCGGGWWEGRGGGWGVRGGWWMVHVGLEVCRVGCGVWGVGCEVSGVGCGVWGSAGKSAPDEARPETLQGAWGSGRGRRGKKPVR